MTIWSLLHISKVSQPVVAQEGYEDRIGSIYSWDSTVANHAKVRVRDSVLIVSEQSVLGIGTISKMEIKIDTKIRSRCAKCRSTKISPRLEITPIFRCNQCKFEFDDPEKDEIEVLKYHGYYGSSWQPFHDLPKKCIEEAYFSKAVQQSIRELDPSLLPVSISQYL
jgi:hypothetical protein